MFSNLFNKALLFHLLEITPTPFPTKTPFLTDATPSPDVWIIIFTGIATIAAVVSLIISIKTYNETVSSKFNGFVYPTAKITLSWIENTPCVITDCLFLNKGANPGNIEDTLLLFKDQSDSGTKTAFRAFLKIVKPDFDSLAEESEPGQRLEEFSVVWLSGKTALKQAILFVPNNCVFDINHSTIFEEQIIYHPVSPDESVSAEWKKSPIVYTFNVSPQNLEDWKNKKQTINIESNQMIQSRTNYFRSM